MGLNRNYETHPDNFYKPEIITVGRDEYTQFFIKFDNLYEIYEFLKSKHAINTGVFSELSSVEGTYSFAGIPYEEAVEDLIDFSEEGYDDFLTLVREIATIKSGYKHEYELRRTLAGGHLNVPAYSTGSPLCYESYERVKKPKFINIHSTLSYPWYTSKQQVLNKAIILVSVINALEKNGYNVNLSTFELSDKYDELIYIVVNVKRFGERTNLQTLYKTNCHVEFLRRILFRILEASAVTNSWSDGYGHTCDEKFTKKVLNIGKDDLYFGTPEELNIKGEDLERDFQACLKALDLNSKFNVAEITDEFKQKVKRLIK